MTSCKERDIHEKFWKVSVGKKKKNNVVSFVRRRRGKMRTRILSKNVARSRSSAKENL
jgi:hypothetical protein